MSAATPWMKFYPQDWRADEKLRLCSLSARGLWIEMLAIMHRSERYGQLLIGGRVPTDAQLAVQVGALPEEVSDLIGQLETAGVFSRTAGGAIYSRRMTRDHRKATNARKNGKNGGNPSLCKDKQKPASVKGEDKGEVKPQKPEARHSVPNGTGEKSPDPVKALFDLGVQILTDGGQSPANARSLVGRWRRDYGDALLASVLAEPSTRTKSEPVSWITERLKCERSQGDNSALYAQAKRYAA